MPSTCPSTRTTLCPPRLPGSTWHALSSGDQRAWDDVTDSGKATIIKDLLHASPSPSQPLSPLLLALPPPLACPTMFVFMTPGLLMIL